MNEPSFQKSPDKDAEQRRLFIEYNGHPLAHHFSYKVTNSAGRMVTDLRFPVWQLLKSLGLHFPEQIDLLVHA